MARYRGPRSKIARKFSEPIYGPDKSFERKNYPPGQHGSDGRRKKLSVYGMQLKEKQKAKYTYGILERQFRNLYKRATKSKGVTGVVLLQLLESRLDNLVYRFGIAPTRAAARQLVTHKHIIVNGENVNIPSFTVKPGDIVGVRPKSKSLESISDSLVQNNAGKYNWIEWDSELLQGKYMNLPQREDIPENINEQFIIELYSK